jgi:predicted dinucleotide-binding enzyme
MGEKGTKVASAALGAAIVDTFLSQRHPKKMGGVRHHAMRQAAEMALGSTVVGPAWEEAAARRR